MGLDLSELEGLTGKELNALRKLLGKEIRKEEQSPPDESLPAPIPFYNDRHQTERLYVKGRSRPIAFVGGVLVAHTKLEAEALRTAGPHIFEGDDLKEPLFCGTCKREFRNSALYQYHMNRHAS